MSDLHNWMRYMEYQADRHDSILAKIALDIRAAEEDSDDNSEPANDDCSQLLAVTVTGCQMPVGGAVGSPYSGATVLVINAAGAITDIETTAADGSAILCLQDDSQSIEWFYGPSGGTATVSAAASMGGLASGYLYLGPSAFGPITPAVVIVPPPGATTTAAGILNADNSITITNRGHGYSLSSPPAIALNPSRGEVYHPILGAVTAFAVTDGGSGYGSTSPGVVMSLPGNTPSLKASFLLTGATISAAQLNAGCMTSGVTFTSPAIYATGVSITAAGSGYACPPAVQFGTSGSGLGVGVLISTSISGGAVTGASIEIPGSYSSATDTLVDPFGQGTSATAVCVMSAADGGSVAGILVTNGGFGYQTVPSVTLSGGSFTSPATASAIIDPTCVAAVWQEYAPVAFSCAGGCFPFSSSPQMCSTPWGDFARNRTAFTRPNTFGGSIPASGQIIYPYLNTSSSVVAPVKIGISLTPQTGASLTATVSGGGITAV